MACLAVAMMMTGILGMSYYSAPPTTTTAIIAEIEDDGNSRQEFLRMNPTNSSLEGKSNHIMVSNHYQRDHRGKYYQGIHEIQQPMSTTNDTTLPIQQFSEEKGDLIMTKQKQRPNDVILATARTSAITDSISESDNTENDSDNNNHNNDDNHSDLFIDEPTQDLVAATSIQLNHQQQQLPTTPTTNGPKNPSEVLHLGYGISCTRRQLGIAGAVFNGVWGGSILAPMRWCKDNTSGVGYLISFGIGAAVVTTTLWILRLLFNTIYYYHGNPVVAYQALPSFHLPVMWLPGGTSGLLWSIGNFFSLISVFYLGEGVGYSVVQAGMLVSGLWGIFYFHEISGIETIAKWIASACITVCGIILLSYEHHKK